MAKEKLLVNAIYQYSFQEKRLTSQVGKSSNSSGHVLESLDIVEGTDTIRGPVSIHFVTPSEKNRNSFFVDFSQGLSNLIKKTLRNIGDFSCRLNSEKKHGTLYLALIPEIVEHVEIKLLSWWCGILIKIHKYTTISREKDEGVSTVMVM